MLGYQKKQSIYISVCWQISPIDSKAEKWDNLRYYQMSIRFMPMVSEPELQTQM